MNLNIGLGIALLLSIMFGGYEHYSYKQYRTGVQSEAAKQKIISEQTDKWNKQVIKDSTNEYQKRLAAIDTKYGRLHYSSSCAMPDSDTKGDSPRTDGETSNYVPADKNLIKDCAITTNMLVTLQDILKGAKGD